MQQYFKMSCDLLDCSNMCVSVQDERYEVGCADGQANPLMNVQNFVLKAKHCFHLFLQTSILSETISQANDLTVPVT